MPSDRPRPGPRLAVGLRPSIRAGRRPPRESTDVLAQSEREFRQTVRELESDALFRQLVARGHVRKAPLAGWIPANRYAEYLDSEIVPLIVAHKLDDDSGWIDEFARADPRSPEDLARRYRIPVGDASRIVRYARHLADEDRSATAGDPAVRERPAAAWAGSADRRSGVAPSDAAEEWLAAFVGRHGLTVEQLRTHVLEGSCSPDESAAEMGVSAAEVAQAREAALSIIVVDAMEPPRTGGEVPRGTAERPAPSGDLRVVASVEPGETGVPRIVLTADDEYALTYRLGPEGVRALYELAKTKDEADALLRRIQGVGMRKATVAGVLCSILRAQSRFFMTGDPEDLAPLSQADLARRVGMAASTVSRAVRGKGIEFRGQRYALRELLVSRAEAVARVLSELPEVPDRVVAEVLSRRWGLRLSRRALAYHRLKLRRRKE